VRAGGDVSGGSVGGGGVGGGGVSGGGVGGGGVGGGGVSSVMTWIDGIVAVVSCEVGSRAKARSNSSACL